MRKGKEKAPLLLLKGREMAACCASLPVPSRLEKGVSDSGEEGLPCCFRPNYRSNLLGVSKALKTWSDEMLVALNPMRDRQRQTA